FHRVHPGPTGSPRETSAVTSDGPSDLGAPMAELPKIISVDDHVVEPAHVWQEYLPQKFKADGPRIERRGIGEMKHVGGGAYEQEFDPDGPPADCWVFGDLVYIHKR